MRLTVDTEGSESMMEQCNDRIATEIVVAYDLGDGTLSPATDETNRVMVTALGSKIYALMNRQVV